MSTLNVPRFILKNTTQNNADLNQERWRHLYDQNSSPPQAPLVDSIDLDKQLPWLTLYKHHSDLLQIKLVTTIGYVQSHDGTNLTTQAKFIKGFPLMLQGSDAQFDNSANITENDWEYKWPFYKEHVEELSTDLSNNFPNGSWKEFSLNSKVITGMRNTTKRNLIILMDNM